MSAPAIVEPVVGAAALVVALGVLHRFGLAIYRTARRVEDTFDLVHRELNTNGGSSVRDAIDRIEKKADKAVSRAQDAATSAHHAAQVTAKALERIERLEGKPQALAIAVNPAPEGAG